jgi:DNA-binding beta-propeller fold protein YncE
VAVLTQLAPGSEFAGHRIDEVIGRGGMGVVYRARHIALGRVVAIKVIAPELLDDPVTKERFLNEARAAASIDHPHVIPIFHAGEHDGVAYLVMRHVEGEDVRTLVRRSGPLPASRAARIAAQVGDALDAIHAAGLVHRDVKPANVLLGAGDHVYVTDFGLAKHVVSTGGTTRSGQWVGTLDFVAPEQIRGVGVDARTDVYALGGLLFYMLCGTAPFAERDSDESKLWAHLTEAPARPSGVRPGVPAAFDAVVSHALAKEPADRQPTAGAVGRAALAAARGEAPAPAPVDLATERETIEAPGPTDHGAPARSAAGDRRGTIADPRPPRAPSRLQRPPRRLALAAAAILVVAALAVAVLLLRGGGDGARTTTHAPAAKTTPPRQRAAAAADPGVRAGVTIRDVGRRPNAIAVVDGAVWVSSASLERIARLREPSGGRLPVAPKVGRAVVGMAVTGNAVWVALHAPGRLVRLSRQTARRMGTLPLPSDATAIDATADAVWVAVRGGAGTPDRVLRFDPATLEQAGSITVPEGVQAIAATLDGELWIAHRNAPTVVRLDRRSGRELRRVRLGEAPYDIAFGAGYAWATLRTDGTVARIDPTTGDTVSIAAPLRPTQILVAGGLVFVTGFIDHTVEVIDPRTARPVGRALDAGLNPFALAGGGRHVWVTAVGTDSVTRLDLR